MDRIKNIINNSSVGRAFYNLFDRWQDECEYEDIDEYGKAIFNTINKQFPKYDIKYVKATEEPFGVIINIGGKNIHVFVKLSNCYLQLCAKFV